MQYYEFCCCGLGIPELKNGGDGEDYTNSKSCIYLYHQTLCGVNPSSVILYRKAKGESEYKKVKYKTVEKIENMAGMIDEDSEESYVSVSYDGPIFRYYTMSVDLVNKKAEVSPLYD